MKEFSATVRNSAGCSATVLLYVERKGNFATVKVDVFGVEMSLAIGHYDKDRLEELKKSQTSVGNYTVSSSCYLPVLHDTCMEAYKCDNVLWMHWEEYWQCGFVWYSKRFTASMTDSESSEFLQYIIEGFTE